MRTPQSRRWIARLIGFGLAAFAVTWFAAGDAWSAAAIGGAGIGGSGPRISTPNISSVGPRGGNFRTGPDGPKGNPDTGDLKPRKGLIVYPTGSGGSSNSNSSAKAFRRLGTGVPPAGEQNYAFDKVIIE